MNSPQFVRAKISNRVTADCSRQQVKNNRYHYLFKFEEDIGWDWLYTQIQKANREFDVEVELWKIRPSGVSDFEVEVREVERREGIDDSQAGLTEFEA